MPAGEQASPWAGNTNDTTERIMKRQYLRLTAFLVAAAALFSGCLGDDEDTTVTTYNDTMITGFQLGTLNRYYDGTLTTLAGTSYPMTIDHVNRLIENLIELPVGTDVAHVVCTVSAKNNGVVFLKAVDSDSVMLHSSADSVDFTPVAESSACERVFRVYAINGQGWRDYTVRLNVSATAGTDFAWTRVSKQTTGVARADSVRLLWAGSQAVVMARTGSKTVVWQSQADGDSISWQQLQQEFGAESWRNCVVKQDTVFVLDGGRLMWSVDLAQWTQHAADAQGLSALVASASHKLFALKADGTPMQLGEGDDAWKEDSTESRDDIQWMPQGVVATLRWPYPTDFETDCLIMAGQHGALSTTVLWRRLCPQKATATDSGRWTFMPFASNNSFTLPSIEAPALGLMPDGQIGIVGTTHSVFLSADQGISWRQSDDHQLPEAIAAGTPVAMGNDGDGLLWLVDTGGNVWTGTLR